MRSVRLTPWNDREPRKPSDVAVNVRQNPEARKILLASSTEGELLFWLQEYRFGCRNIAVWWGRGVCVCGVWVCGVCVCVCVWCRVCVYIFVNFHRQIGFNALFCWQVRVPVLNLELKLPLYLCNLCHFVSKTYNYQPSSEQRRSLLPQLELFPITPKAKK